MVVFTTKTSAYKKYIPVFNNGEIGLLPPPSSELAIKRISEIMEVPVDDVNEMIDDLFSDSYEISEPVEPVSADPIPETVILPEIDNEKEEQKNPEYEIHGTESNKADSDSYENLDVNERETDAEEDPANSGKVYGNEQDDSDIHNFAAAYKAEVLRVSETYDAWTREIMKAQKNQDLNESYGFPNNESDFENKDNIHDPSFFHREEIKNEDNELEASLFAAAERVVSEADATDEGLSETGDYESLPKAPVQETLPFEVESEQTNDERTANEPKRKFTCSNKLAAWKAKRAAKGIKAIWPPKRKFKARSGENRDTETALFDSVGEESTVPSAPDDIIEAEAVISDVIIEESVVSDDSKKAETETAVSMASLDSPTDAYADYKNDDLQNESEIDVSSEELTEIQETVEAEEPEMVLFPEHVHTEWPWDMMDDVTLKEALEFLDDKELSGLTTEIVHNTTEGEITDGAIKSLCNKFGVGYQDVYSAIKHESNRRLSRMTAKRPAFSSGSGETMEMAMRMARKLLGEHMKGRRACFKSPYADENGNYLIIQSHKIDEEPPSEFPNERIHYQETGDGWAISVGY